MSPFRRKHRLCRPFNGTNFIKPRGVPLSELEILELGLDELEAIHLCDYEDMSQAEAANKMNISTGTLQRLIYSGHKKIADALYTGKAIHITTHEDIIIHE